MPSYTFHSVTHDPFPVDVQFDAKSDDEARRKIREYVEKKSRGAFEVTFSTRPMSGAWLLHVHDRRVRGGSNDRMFYWGQRTIYSRPSSSRI